MTVAKKSLRHFYSWSAFLIL